MSAFLALLAVACAPLPTQPPAAGRAQSAGSLPVEPARTRPATVRRASGDVAVRLAQFERERELQVSGALSAKLERRGAKLVLDGGAERDEVLLEAETGLLKLGERSYAGTLRVRVPREGNGLEVTNLVDLEEYIGGVVASEVALWNCGPEALRAQAVAARSYAVAALDERGRKRSEPYLFSDTRDMAYNGVFTPRNARERELAKQLARALESTRGRVLREGERVVDARFHAACGGATADAREVFPEADFECLSSVACPACNGGLAGAREAASAAWNFTASRAALDTLAARFRVGSRITGLEPVRSDGSGRWLEVELKGPQSSVRVRAEELRRALGADKLPSLRIEKLWPAAGEPITGGLRFDGRGRGHGVGLCQEAARECARAGWSAERILAHFYPGAEIVDFR